MDLDGRHENAPNAWEQPAGPLAELEPEPLRARRKKTPVVLVAGVAIAAVVLAAVLLSSGGDGSHASPAIVLSQAASRTTGSGTARISLSEQFTIDGRTTTVASGNGAMDFGSDDHSITLTVGPLREEARSVGGATYLSVTGVSLPLGAHWVSLTSDDLKQYKAVAAALGSNNPASGLGFLAAARGTPTAVGRSTLDGEATTEYTFSLDLTQFTSRLSNLPGFSASSLDALGSVMDLASVPGRAWIDDRGRVRKFDIEFSVPGESGKVVSEFGFSHFDEPVHVEPPAAADTVPFAQVPDLLERVRAAAARAAAGPTD